VIVETERGVHNIEEIVKVEGIDLVFIGPTDLSQSLGFPGQITHPVVQENIDRVTAAAKQNGMPLGIHVYEIDEGDELANRAEQGFQFLTVLLDTALFYQACVQVRNACNVVTKSK
jgi:4-hydroxy-2-oxoheptanedioate aldolase